jgi:hypothetical protein
MMEYAIYDLLLQSTRGMTLLGTLRFRYPPSVAVDAANGLEALLADTLQRPTVELYVVPLEGDIRIGLLTGATPVPLGGLSFNSLFVPLTMLFNSTDPTRGLGLQLFLAGPSRLAGGLIWQAGTPREMVFSVLATGRPSGLAEETADAQEAIPA